jgi:hypothetical protein
MQATSPQLLIAPERELILGNSHAIRFTLEGIPDPPAVSFATNLPRLNSMWDDTTPHWCGSSPLIISGHPIPVVYWPEVYKYGKKDQWKGTKAKWFEWKVVSSLLYISASLTCSTYTDTG